MNPPALRRWLEPQHHLILVGKSFKAERIEESDRILAGSVNVQDSQVILINRPAHLRQQSRANPLAAVLRFDSQVGNIAAGVFHHPVTG